MEFISYRVSCFTLKGRWCDIKVLNVHASPEDKDDDINDSFHEEIEQLFDPFPVYQIQILLGDFHVIHWKLIEQSLYFFIKAIFNIIVLIFCWGMYI